jgi:hypothetical protein
MAQIPATLFFTGTCVVFGLLVDGTFRRWLHAFSREAWGGAYLTLALWWFLAAGRRAPSRAEAKVLGRRETRLRVWAAYRATLQPVLIMIVPSFLVLAILAYFRIISL